VNPEIVYDSGALIAAERGDAKLRRLHLNLRAAGVRPLVPGPVLAQVWRGGAKQYQLAALIRDCHVVLDYTEADYRRTGWLLGQAELPPKKRPDVVDAIVVVTAARHCTDMIVTSDPFDLAAYAKPLGLRLDLITV
jgi:predicted nucleic acid-binding protein